jgi:hypothetical protein
LRARLDACFVVAEAFEWRLGGCANLGFGGKGRGSNVVVVPAEI